jgi:hypothetical protein
MLGANRHLTIYGETFVESPVMYHNGLYILQERKDFSLRAYASLGLVPVVAEHHLYQVHERILEHS